MVQSRVHVMRATHSAALEADQLAVSTSITEGGDLLCRCSYWRDTLPGFQIGFPARLLRAQHAAEWVRGNDAYIDVSSAEELELMRSSGIPPVLVTVDTEGAATRTLWHAIGLGVGRLVVSHEREIRILSAMVQRPRRVLVDISDEYGEDLLGQVQAHLGLDIIGLRCRLCADCVQDVDRVMGRIAGLVDRHGLIVTHLRLVVPKPQGHPPFEPYALATAIQHAHKCSYERCGLPPFAMGVSVDWQTLLATQV